MKNGWESRAARHVSIIFLALIFLSGAIQVSDLGRLISFPFSLPADELTDLVVIALWWTIGIYLSLLWIPKINQWESMQFRPRWSPLIETILLISGPIAFLSTFVLDFDSGIEDNFQQLSVSEFLLSGVLVSSSLFLALAGKAFQRKQVFLICGLALVFCLPLIQQSPSSLRDPGHFLFFANELAAPAAGHLSLVEFASQYTNFLGIPLAPIKFVDGSLFPLISLMYLIVLQLICIAVPLVILSVGIGSRVLLGTSVMILGFSALVLAGIPQNLPSRILFPLLLIFVATTFERLGKLENLNWIRGSIIGFLVGTTLLNNLDFGAPAVASLFMSFFALGPSLRSSIRTTLNVFAWSLTTVTVVFLVLWALFGKIWFEALVLFITQLGTAPSWTAPMSASGIHVGLAMTFVCAIVIARSRHRLAVIERDFAFASIMRLLFFSGVWGLFSLIYFAGRSFTSVAVAGSGFQFVICAACIFVWIVKDWNRHQAQLANTSVFALRTTAVLICVIATVFFVRIPLSSQIQGQLGDFGPTYQPLSKFENELSTSRSFLIEQKVPTYQILPSSNLIELSTGVPSALLVSHPVYLNDYPRILDIHCRHFGDLIEKSTSPEKSILLILDSEEDYIGEIVLGCRNQLKAIPMRNPDFFSSLIFLKLTMKSGS